MVLKTFSGQEWKVAIYSHGFGNRWETFAKDNHLKYGYMLEFHYMGEGVFHVVIYNDSMMEGNINDGDGSSKTLNSMDGN